MNTISRRHFLERGDIAPALATLDVALSPAQRQLIYVDNRRALLKSKGRV